MKTKNMNKYRTVCRYGSNNQWNNRKKKENTIPSTHTYITSQRHGFVQVLQ